MNPIPTPRSASFRSSSLLHSLQVRALVQLRGLAMAGPLAVISVILLLASPGDSEPIRIEPLRVATLLPFVEDALRLAPERAHVVASVRRELHQSPGKDVIDLGNPHSPSFEALAQARAELVVGDRAIHGVLASRLEAIGAKLILIDTASVSSTLDALTGISTSIGGADALDAAIEKARRELEGLALDAPVSLLPLFGAPGSFYAMSDRVWLGDLARQLGFQNVTPARGDERFPGLVALSDETMAMMRPDMVVLVTHGDPRKIRQDLARRTERGGAWAALDRAPLGIHVLDPQLFSANPGLSIVDAARALVALVGGGVGDGVSEGERAASRRPDPAQ